MNGGAPLVTCIMPTYNRRQFVPRAIGYFLRQDYDRSELLIVDDGTDPVSDLVPAHPRVRYMALPSRMTVGAKRNLACEQAAGDIILHWDDDDWHARRRVRYQVESLLAARADVCGISRILFFDCRDRRAWIYTYPTTERFWIYGSSLCYRHEFWRHNRFADVNIGEDTRFVWESQGGRMVTLPNYTFHVSIMHAGNVSAPRPAGEHWSGCEPNVMHDLFGADRAFYETASAAPAACDSRL
jgi:glycosyltransferase involved in cell wall biosynthesis